METLGASLRIFADVLDRLGIPYLIGGSVASSVRGIARATRDIDIVAHILGIHAEPLARALGKDWYAEPNQIREAISHGRPFNVIHIRSGNKFDIFPATGEFHATQFRRATKVAVPFLEDDRLYPVTSAEDILLAKLRWYRDGGEVSTGQWNDIGGIVATNPSLDLEYLRDWAAKLRITDLLERALHSDEAQSG